jgi:hypothetical protein
VGTACAVAGIALIVIGPIVGLAVEGATIFGMMAICAALIPTGGSMTPLALLAVLVTLAVGSVIAASSFALLPIGGGFLLARTITGTWPEKFDFGYTGPIYY